MFYVYGVDDVLMVKTEQCDRKSPTMHIHLQS